MSLYSLILSFETPGWSEALMVAHTTLLEISCYGSLFFYVCTLSQAVHWSSLNHYEKVYTQNAFFLLHFLFLKPLPRLDSEKCRGKHCKPDLGRLIKVGAVWSCLGTHHIVWPKRFFHHFNLWQRQAILLW